MGLSAEYAGLCERIQEHCGERHWFGPDADNTKYSSPTNYLGWFDALTSKEYERAKQRGAPFKCFMCPLASDDEIRKTEQALGFALPTALRAIYQTLANGGFGPGYGLVGASGGWLSDDYPHILIANSIWTQDLYERVDWLWRNDPTIAFTLTHGGNRLSEQAAHVLKRHRGRYLECEEPPDGLITLCHWGCGIFSKLDHWSGHVYIAQGWTRHDFPGTKTEVESQDIVLGLEYQAASVETWLELWLNGELNQGRATTPVLMTELDSL